MYTLVFIFVFLLGTIIGSFLNVLIYRFNTGKTFITGRSICMSCNKTLAWYELLPVLSFLIQSGRCRKCASKISHQYPTVEILTGLMFVGVVARFAPLLSVSLQSYVFLIVLYAFLFSILIVISVYDLRHKIIPDRMALVYGIFAFLSVFINQSGVGAFFVMPSILNLVSGLLFAIPFALLWLVSSGRWMGLGDAKLMLGIGWMLGPVLGLASVVLSFWLGAIFSLGMIFLSKKKISMKTEIPFAPFLIISSFLVFIFNLDIVTLTSWIHL